MTKRQCKRLQVGDRFRRQFRQISFEYRVISVEMEMGRWRPWLVAFTVRNDIGAEMRIRLADWIMGGWWLFMRPAKQI